jgi:hypothetical protein
MTFAVFLETPGSEVKSSMLWGISPEKRLTSMLDAF